jgi:hypothetical protein
LAEEWVNWMGFQLDFWGRIFWGNLSRRGVHVNTPEIGSRGDVLCFWGNIGFYADLRRGLEWALLDFGGLLGDPRGGGEEGGHYVSLFVLLGVN